MNLYPTSTSRVFVLVAGVAVAAGVVIKEPIVVIWMGSILAAIAVIRAVAGVNVAVARRQGFEMLLPTTTRRFTVTRLEPFELEFVLRNRSDFTLDVCNLAVLASNNLDVRIGDNSSQIGAYGSLNIKLTGKGTRIGYGAIHGLYLRVLHSSGAFEAPLVFFNPVQFSIYPAIAPYASRPSRGGFSRHPSDADRAGRMSGDSIELRELRSYQPGDALRKIAWKASARRGSLLVRDEELMERQTLWVLVDASTELWGGPCGKAPLDEGIDRVSSILHKHISLGDRVGLAILSSRPLLWLGPDTGMAHFARMHHGLQKALQLWDSDRSGADESDVSRIVLEHVARIDASAVEKRAPLALENLADLATRALRRYEFELPDVYAKNEHERNLRAYAAAFGLTCPPRLEAERWQTDNQFLEAIERCVADKPSRIVIVSVEPTATLLRGYATQQRKFSRARTRVTWLNLDALAGMPELRGPVQQAVNDSIRWQSESARHSAFARLKRVGIGIEPMPPARRQTYGADRQ